MIAFLTRSFDHYIKAWKQYYPSMIIALIASSLAIVLLYFDSSDPVISRILLACGLAFPLFTLEGWTRQHKLGTYRRWLRGIALLASGGFYRYLSIHNIFEVSAAYFNSQWFVIVMSMLLAWLSPLIVSVFFRNQSNNYLRQDWRLLISHFVVAGVSGLILWGGLSASLASIEYLFDLFIHDRRYLYIGVVSLGIIGTSILFTRLVGIKQDDYDTYPRIFKFFGLYVFFPLAIVYAVILLSYGLKILGSGIRPKGMVARMVIGYTIWGGISYLLSHPLRQDNRFVYRASKGYLMSLIVFSMLLFGAVYVRISNYGVTVLRYLLVMIALWMGLSGIRGLRKQDKSLSGMIMLLVGLMISSTYLPRNASLVSQASQIQKAHKLMQDAGFWPLDEFAEQGLAVESLRDDQQQALGAITRLSNYIYQNFSAPAMVKLFPTSEQSQRENKSPRRNMSDYILRDVFGLSGDLESIQYYPTSDPEESSYFYLSRDTQYETVENIDKFSTMIDVVSYNTIHYLSEDQSLQVDSDRSGTITIRRDDQTISISLQDFAEQIYTMSRAESPRARIDTEAYSIIINNASGQKRTNIYHLESFDVLLLIP